MGFLARISKSGIGALIQQLLLGLAYRIIEGDPERQKQLAEYEEEKKKLIAEINSLNAQIANRNAVITAREATIRSLEIANVKLREERDRLTARFAQIEEKEQKDVEEIRAKSDHDILRTDL